MGLNVELGWMIATILRVGLSMKDWFGTAIPAISQTAGTILLTAIWQSAVVGVCLAVCVRLVPRANAAHRFLIWAAGFAAAIGLPILYLLTQFAAQTRFSGPPSFPSDSIKPLIQLDLRWSIAISGLWAVASLYRAADLAIHSLLLRKLWKSAKPIQAQTGYASALTIAGRNSVELCVSNELERPGVIGFLAPRILIPEWLFARLTPDELDQIVLHEAEHLRRSDDWTNLLQKLALVVFPLNPVLLWIERQLCREREMACDEGVVRVTCAPRAYAACLANLAERDLEHRTASVSSGALSLGAWQRRTELVHRVHTILRRKPGLGPLGARALLAMLLCGLTFGSVELVRCPQLIAFTSNQSPRSLESPQPPETAQLRSTPSSQPVQAHLHERGMAGAFAASERTVSTSRSNRPYLTELKATIPFRSQGLFGNSATFQQTGRNSATTKLASEPYPGMLERTASRQEPEQDLLKAEIADPDVNLTQESSDHGEANQAWIVVTTWEFVGTSDESSVLANSATNSTGQVANRTPDDPPVHRTLTQLIFRVLPASFNSKSPAESPIRSGWLVIQL